MPVTFAPADPFSASVASGYGQNQAQLQRDRMAQDERMQNARLYAQGGIAGAEITGRAEQQSLANRQHVMEMEFEANKRQQAQERQIDAQREAQFNEWALRGQAVSQHEIMQMNRQERAVNEILTQKNNGFLTDEEAAPLIAEIRTGINTTQRRLQEQQAQQSMAREKQMIEQTAKDQALLQRNQKIQGQTYEENIVPDAGAILNERRRLQPKYQAIASIAGAEVAQAEMEKEARANVISRGQYRVQTGIDGKGNAVFHDDLASHAKDPAEAEAKAAELEMKHHEAAMRVYEHKVDRYDREFTAAVDSVRKIHEGRMKDGREKEEPGMAQIYEEARNDLKARGIVAPGEPPAPPSRSKAGEADPKAEAKTRLAAIRKQYPVAKEAPPAIVEEAKRLHALINE